MAKQIYIDSNGNEVLVSGTITNDNNLPHYTGTPTAGTTAYEIASKLDKTSVKTASVTVSGSSGQYVTNLDWSDYNIINAWVTGVAYLILIRPSGSGKVVFNIYAYNSGFAPISDASVTVNFSYIDLT